MSKNNDVWYTITDDGTGDYYVVPVNKMDEWVEAENDGFDCWVTDNGLEYPDWAHYIGGSPSDLEFCGKYR